MEAADPAVLLADGAPRLTDALAIVRAGANPPAQVAAAAAAGAAAVVLADPGEPRTSPRCRSAARRCRCWG